MNPFSAWTDLVISPTRAKSSLGIRAETLLSLSKHIKEARGINQIQEGTVEVIITSICMFRDNLSKVWGFWWVFWVYLLLGFFLMGVF